MGIKRLVSSLLGLPLVIILFALTNNYIISIAISLIAILCLYEYFTNLNKEIKPIKYVGYLTCALISVINIIDKEYYFMIIIPIIILLVFLKVIFSNMETNLVDVGYTLLGICYIPFFIVFIPIIYNMENGNFLIWYAICASWGSDVLAYCIGKKFGKHKLTKISPNKTIEGSIGGILGAVLFTVLFTYIFNTFFGMNFSYLFLSTISIFLSIIGQIGDIAASSIKRLMKIKDFSNLIPGHGGILDRIDSLIFITPFAYILFKLFF